MTISDVSTKKSELVDTLPRQSTEEEEVMLMRRIADKKDVNALETLYKAYRPRLAGFLRRVTEDQELISESVNEVMYRVWKSAHQFKGGAKVSTWIFSIAYRECCRLIAKEGRHHRIADALSAEESHPGSVDEVAATEQHDLVQVALEQLPTDQRLAIEMSYFLGRPVKEIALIAGCPENTIKTRLHHARRKLKTLIPSLAGPEPSHG